VACHDASGLEDVSMLVLLGHWLGLHQHPYDVVLRSACSCAHARVQHDCSSTRSQKSAKMDHWARRTWARKQWRGVFGVDMCVGLGFRVWRFVLAHIIDCKRIYLVLK